MDFFLQSSYKTYELSFFAVITILYFLCLYFVTFIYYASPCDERKDFHTPYACGFK